VAVACKDWAATLAPEKHLLLKDNVRNSKHATAPVRKVPLTDRADWRQRPHAAWGPLCPPCCAAAKTA